MEDKIVQPPMIAETASQPIPAAETASQPIPTKTKKTKPHAAKKTKPHAAKKTKPRAAKKTKPRAAKKTKPRAAKIKSHIKKQWPGGLCISMAIPLFKRFERARAMIGKREGSKLKGGLSRSKLIARALEAWFKRTR